MLATLISFPSISLSFSDSFCHLLLLCFLHFTQRLLSLFTSLTCSVTGVNQLLKCVKEMAFCMSLKSYLIFAMGIGGVCILHLGYTVSTAHFQSQVAHLFTSLLSWLFQNFSKGLSCFSLCVEQRVIAGKRLCVYESPFSKFPM